MSGTSAKQVNRHFLLIPSVGPLSLTIDFPATAGDVASSLMPTACAALSLCTNLRSFSWTGGGFLSNDDSSLVAHLDIILARHLPLHTLVLRASPGLSPAAWTRLGKLTSLCSLGLWCLDADHTALLEWLAALGETLTRLELVISPLSDQYMHCV
jgi:hypothetical protein